MADREGGLQLVGSEERMPVAIPRRPHDPAGEIELDVVDTGLDVLADRAHEPLGSVARQGEARAEGVAGGGREKPATRVEPRATCCPESNARLSATSMKCGVPAMRSPVTPASRSARCALARYCAVSSGTPACGIAGPLQVHVRVPESGEQVRAAQVDDLGAPRGRRAAAVQHLDDALVLDGDAGSRRHAGRDRVDEPRVGQDERRRHDACPGGAPKTGSTCSPKRRIDARILSWAR